MGNNSGESRLYFMNGAKKRNNEAPDNYIFSIGVNSNGYVYVSNGTDTETSTIGGGITGTENISNTVMGETKNYKSTGWFNASCIIDFEKGNAKVTVKRNTATETLNISLKSGTKQISGIGVLNGAKTGGVVAMDDIALYEFTYPAFTLSDEEKNFYVDDNETVTLSDITGEISVESNNTDVATVSYSNGTITINGKSEGTALITVTGTNDGLSISKEINVNISGYAAKYTVVKAEYDTKVAGLDAAGQAYWAANVTPAASVTDEASYNAAVAALPTTYVAAVKAQTSPGSDMTDAMPSGLTDWNCQQGNGPGTYATNYTETYSDGNANPKFSDGNIMTQTITGLQEGYYGVQFYGVVNSAWSVSEISETTSDLVQAFANNATKDIDVYAQTSCTPSNYLHTINAYVDGNGVLTYGLKVKEGVADAGNWAVAKIHSLTYLGNATSTTYTVNAVDGNGNILKEIVSDEVTYGGTITVPYPQYVLSGTTLYSINNNSSGDWYRKTYTIDEYNKIINIVYNGSTVKNVAFYTEAEDVLGVSKQGYTNRASNGQVAKTGSNSTFIDVAELNAGTYKIYAKGLNGNNSSKTVIFKVGENQVFNFSITQGTNQTGNSEEFDITEPSMLSFAGECPSTGGLDLFYVVKIADIKAISSVGYATFSSTSALDFTDVDNAKAYIVTEKSGTSIKLQQVTGKVAAGTGLILKSNNGGEANVTIPVTTDEGTYYDLHSKTINYLFGIDHDYDLSTPDEGTHYVLTVQDDKVVFAPIGSTTAAVKAGQAALWLPASAGAKALTLSFTDDITGINEVGNTESKAGKIYYNLQGQRVSEPKEGIYVVEGKKVLVNKMSH